MGVAAIRTVSITLSAMKPRPQLQHGLGYDRLMCTECGKMVKANYKDSLGHAYQSGACPGGHLRDAGQDHGHL